LEIRQEQIGTRDRFNSQVRRKSVEKRLQDANANHTQDTFPCLLVVPGHGILSTCQFPFSTTDTSMWLLTRPRRSFSLIIVGICTA
ncbi:hypothetical protein BAE44_0022689, partial [Dichanthelium oligosanthes]